MISNSFPLAFPICLGFFLLHAAENHQIYARIKGAIDGTVAHGYQKAMEGMLVNRVGAVIYHFLTSLYIESFGLLKHFLIAILFSGFGLLIFNLFILRKINNHISYTNLAATNKNKKLLNFAACLAPLFVLFGLSIPYALGIMFFDFRLTLANLGFLFNTVFTLLTVLIIDKKVSKIIDNDPDSILQVGHGIIKFRLLGIMFFIILILLLIFLS